MATSFKVQVQELMDRMAAACRAGDAKGCASLFTPDAILFSPYAPATHGREHIEALHRTWITLPNSKQLAVVDAGSGGDVGWCLANYSEGDVAGNGTSLCTLVRQSDGEWLIRLCSLNSEIPPLAGE